VPADEDGSRSVAERLALAVVGALATATDPREAREVAGELEARLRGDVERVSERAELSLAGLFRELGLVTRAELEELELRVAQLEHRLRLLERPPG
jgi:polyhydroxyalkanoate synthesis regulator phasin